MASNSMKNNQWEITMSEIMRAFPNLRNGFVRPSTLWLMLCLGMGGGFIGSGLFKAQRQPVQATAVIEHSSSAINPWQHEVIEHIHVGQRVVTPNAVPGVDMPTAVDPATWKLLELSIDIPPHDGAPADFAEIQTLQSPTWIAENRAIPGASVQPPLDLREMGMEQAEAQIVAINPCPPIDRGPGRVVLTTINHLNQFVFDLAVEDAGNHQETIGVSGWHKLYSESRQEWVSASSLTPGETLQGHDGPVTVESLRRRPGNFRVYNITVEGEHVFYASSLDVLSHNNNCLRTWQDIKALTPLQQLAENAGTQRMLLQDALGGKGTGMIAHHLIPLEAETQYGGLIKKAAAGGFNMNGASNGILLNAVDHVGGHPIYNKSVLDALEDIPTNLSAAKTASRLQKIAEKLRNSITAGTFGG